MSKATPGPWVWDAGYHEEPGKYSELLNTDGIAILKSCDGCSIIEHDANARLIASAPDLLSALKNLVQFYCGDEDMNAPQWAKAKAAVEKAEGGK